MKPIEQGKLRLAIQKDGRLTEETLHLLGVAGLEFEKQNRRLFTSCKNFPLEILFVRDDDIPKYIVDGTADLGIVGQNLLIEEGYKVKQLLPLGFGYCSLAIGVPRESKIENIAQLKNKKVATTYLKSSKRFFRQNKIPIELIYISGSVEVAPIMGVADAIVDLISTGNSMRLNDLRPIDIIYSSEALLITSNQVLKNEDKHANVELLLRRFKSVLAAKKYKYVMMNAPVSSLNKIIALVPGSKSPTIVPLADKDWVAIHSVIEEETFWEVIENLKKAGAQGILVNPIEKFIL